MVNESSKYKWLTVEEVSTPQSWCVEIIRDSWWCHRQDGKVAIYRGHSPQCNTPQCNSNRQISEHVGERTMPGYAGSVFIPLAFIPHNCKRY